MSTHYAPVLQIAAICINLICLFVPILFFPTTFTLRQYSLCLKDTQRKLLNKRICINFTRGIFFNKDSKSWYLCTLQSSSSLLTYNWGISDNEDTHFEGEDVNHTGEIQAVQSSLIISHSKHHDFQVAELLKEFRNIYSNSVDSVSVDIASLGLRSVLCR